MKTACGRCPATWTGMKVEHCTACCGTFSGPTAGDMHRVGDHAVSVGPNRRRCLTTQEMIERGLVATDNAFGTPVWGKRPTQEHPFSSTRSGLGPLGRESVRTTEAQEGANRSTRLDSAGLGAQGWAPGPLTGNQSLTEMEVVR